MQVSEATVALLRDLARRPGHDEVKSGFRQLLIQEFGVEYHALRFEQPVPEVRGRLDALVGRTVFEAKRNLEEEWDQVARRMPRYLEDREREEGHRFVGIASDGLKWVALELEGGRLDEVGRITLDPDRPELFLAWLDGMVALKSSLAPEPLTIRAELGPESVAFRRVMATLKALWARLGRQPAVELKRQLWGGLLKMVYGREVENDELWFQHTFLVVVAKSIALAVMRLPEDDPRRLLSGEAFTAVGLYGAVESDFFDWVVADAEGEALVRRIMAHIRRFRLTEVQSDVLKVLYEALIDRAERHGLGEYYTPDWLAAKVVRRAVERPLEQKVLDPACGSGAFLFHAIRLFLAEAVDAGMEPGMVAKEVCAHVAGLDIHPVAVIIARVTYLLALAPALDQRQGSLSLPVYLGDAMQLSTSDMMGGKELTIRVPPPRAGEGASGEVQPGREQLDFPETFCKDPALFDKAIERMRTASLEGLTRTQVEAALFNICIDHYYRPVTEELQRAITDMGKAYAVMDRLHRQGRDTIWAYVARNLSKPLAFASGGGWGNVVVGNPPWVALRHMSADLQKRFKELAKGEGVYVGGRFATQNDLSALFTVRAVHLYLRSGGRIAFVLPMAALTRGQFEGLRQGSFHSVRIAWDEAWTMDDGVAPLFPVPSCVVFGRRRAIGRGIPETVRAYTGRLPLRDAPEALADRKLTVIEGARALEVAKFEGGSPYRKSFRQGATLVPRMLCLIERRPVGRLGMDRTAPLVASRRSSNEKLPYKDISGVENKVEKEFIRHVVLGESIIPYGVFRLFEGIVPALPDGTVMDADAAANRGYSGLHGWMRKAEGIWDSASDSDGMKLVQRWNYHNELSVQFPIPQVRVVYAASGTIPAACMLVDPRAIVEHALYWAAMATEAEARYLVSILNSETARARVEQFQARGQFGARHFDKVMFNLPIPRFDPDDPLHQALAAAAERAEAVAAAVTFPDGIPFQRARRMVRDSLAESGVGPEIDRLVARLLDGA